MKKPIENRVKLISLDTHYNPIRNCWYLSASYLCEDESEVYQIDIPNILLPILTDYLPTLTQGGSDPRDWHMAIDLGVGELEVCKDKNGVYYTKTVKEYKTKEMTIEEIEKKLGYKVKIVNNKNP